MNSSFNTFPPSICERITPRLAHANAAVVLSTVKVLMKFMDQITNTEFVQMLQKKLAPPLVTLLSAEPEIQVNILPPHTHTTYNAPTFSLGPGNPQMSISALRHSHNLVVPNE